MNRFFRMFVAPMLAAAFGLLFASAPAMAGTGLITTPADKFVMAPGGVDMRTGRYAYKQNDLSIGGTDESGGIAFTRILQSDVPGHLNPFGNFSDNWDIMVSEMRIDHAHPENFTGSDYRIEFHFGGRSKTFETYGVDGFMAKGNGPWGSLSYTGTNLDSPDIVYTFTAPDGTVAVFRPIGYGDCSNSTQVQVRCAYVSSITEPDGTVFTFNYVASGGADAVQLHQVTSSRGYALLIEGSNNLVTKACVLNLTQTTVPANGLCPSTAPATATYTYNAALQRLASAVRPGGATESFTYSNVTSTGLTMAFTKPGQSAPWLTNTLTYSSDENLVQQEVVNHQAFADGQAYTYSYNFPPPIIDDQRYYTVVGGNYTDALGQRTIVAWDFPPTPGGPQPGAICYQSPCTDVSPDDILNRAYQTTLGPVQVTDPLGRVTTADYCDPIPEAQLPAGEKYRCIVVPMVSFIDPEGIKTDLSHDGAGNITQVVRHAKPGSGLADIVTSATYDFLHPKSHDKPLTTTDANGNTTTYTYDPNHGGVLTETDPAVNGVTPQKRYSYAQRYAWISNGAGGYVKEPTPVWVLTQMSFCKAGNPNAADTGCANGSSDEVITTYDYGPDAGPNNLNLRGTVVDSGGLALRTCTTYDALGNKISETKPRAGLASCP